ncbi:docking protein 2 [Nylanderia fulva]|uniref:docking protein 2 n=1 Tax=Nylanderia fulva TaxID=613905 RepID=UPI0010FB5D70|nr:docking protein 2 [Nylanderia fulva]
MEPEEPLMQGILLLPPQGMLGQLKKTWHKRFCQLFRTSNYGIKRVEIYDNQEEAVLQSHTPRIITLDACIKIAPSNQSHVFIVVTKSGIHYFGCYSEIEMTQWITAFQLVAFKDSVSNQTIEENNDLYCTSGEGVFSVKVVETDASRRCGLEARNYTLVIATVDMKLMDGDNVLFTWPYRYIRRYGYKDGKFIFEAGRKCESGEGSFRLEHSSQQEIFRCMYLKMRSMKKLLNEESNPNIECNDAQYHAALSMEAGSRAALPPSSNNSSNLIDIDFPTPQSSQKPSTTSSSSMDSITSSSRSINKPKPAKPPRKYFGNLLEKKNLDSEFLDLPTCGEYRTLSQANSPELSHKSIGDVMRNEEEKHSYDIVEIRNDAWKTHGIDSVHHTERVNSILPVDRDKENDSDDLQYEIMMPIRNHDTPSIQNRDAKTDESDYDKLEHFGSATKLGPKPPPYKYTNSSQIIHSSISHGESSNLINSAWSNYDIVEDMSAVRLADDSHLGYGIIRKKQDPPETTSASGPQHKVFNNSEYAIVSKPKRV